MNKTLSEPPHKHGGKRNNAGRKAQYQEKTVVMRVPVSRVDAIKSWLQPRPQNDIESIHNIKKLVTTSSIHIPFPLESIAAGFPSPAQDDIEQELDLNQYLVKNPISTFMLKVNSLSMRDAGIDIGDKIIIDKGLEAMHGDIVVALLNNEFTVKRYMCPNNTPYDFWLKAENPEFPDIYPHENDSLQIWGVVTCILKKLR
ncbi:translesion error-prone DNA polymerase V autoproteolytic subunit [Acinetobacter sp. S40]|uniref:LexA family protein n=1 Tax=unclassified Acinetobacter TaxID=196816 RepID=UPI00190DED3D|nr:MULTISPECIES: translesion error-prone DNA polymerase V autoproteolytic subunit [unclassified Acinetobacter]MBJ9984331.1 translesion error-prone DNA polymerase V autoproteolytic subunit [Acinetobacter sp. S40]MBK0062048.1 translesion error-prone DNA polymerase V autoproteolytic subunit [Acinetobacter sp. S55]MBK0065852.1 translesion error-prone DNA polymerase V autoproteolytic subunit [Acinetobacter sp. S54]